MSAGSSGDLAAEQPWPFRYEWVDLIALDTRLTDGCKAWLLLLASRSDNDGKRVWGTQARMAADSGKNERTIRRYAVEAETLGYIACFRSAPERGPGGTYIRQASNIYYPRLPGDSRIDRPAPRRVRRGLSSLPTEVLERPRLPRPFIPPELRWEVWERDDFRCRQCGTRRDLTVDHVISLARGGPTTLENLQTLCRPHNSAKGAQ